MNAICFKAAPLKEISALMKLVGTKTDGNVWFAGMLLKVFHEKKLDGNRRPVLDANGNAVTECHVKLMAHESPSRATVIPLNTRFPYDDLHTLRRSDRWTVWSLKRDILAALHGEAWHVHATIQNPDGTSDIGDEMPVAVQREGAADTDGSVRKRRRGRQHEQRRADRDQEESLAAA